MKMKSGRSPVEAYATACELLNAINKPFDTTVSIHTVLREVLLDGEEYDTAIPRSVLPGLKNLSVSPAGMITFYGKDATYVASIFQIVAERMYELKRYAGQWLASQEDPTEASKILEI